MREEQNQELNILLEKFLPKQGESPDATIKRLKELAKLPTDRAVFVLNHIAASEKNEKILFFLVKEMGKYKDSSSVQVLIDLLTGFSKEKDRYLNVRSSVATTLGNIKDERAILPLMYVMNDREESYRLRLWAADALGKIGNSQAVNPLIKIVSDEEEKSVYLKESAAKALGMIGDDRAVDSLVDILETQKGIIDKFTFFKEKIVEALGKLGGRKEKQLKALKNALLDEFSQVRISAIEALEELEEDGITELIEPLVTDKDEDVAKTAIYALYAREGKGYIQQLLEKEGLSMVCREVILELLEEEEECSE